MKHISILVPKGPANLNCIEGTFKAFNTVNEFLEAQGQTPVFNTQLVGIDKDVHTYDRFFNVQPETSIGDVTKTDLIVIPPVNGKWQDVIDLNSAFFPWINKQHRAGAEVASLCVGTFLLASTGLLEHSK